MKLNEDLVVEIIASLPLKKLMQCKTLNKRFNHLISDPNFAKTHALSLPGTPDFVFYTSTMLKKFSPYQRTPSSRIITFGTRIVFPIEESPILNSCNGLLLLDFYQFDALCVFNPATRMHQLIPPPITVGTRLGAGLASDYPTSDQYKVVIVQTLVEEKGYKFHMFSSEDSAGVWQEFQLTTDLGNNKYFSKAAYLNDTLNWLMADGCFLTFDTKKKYARILNNFLEAVKHLGGDFNGYAVRTTIESHTWFGTANGKLHLVCVLDKYIVGVAYDDTINNWEIVRITDNFSTGLLMGCWRLLPIWFDSKRVLFLANGALGTYDFERRICETVIKLPKEFCQFDSFHPFAPTLAKVRRTLPDSVEGSKNTKITNALDRLKKLF